MKEAEPIVFLVDDDELLMTGFSHGFLSGGMLHDKLPGAGVPDSCS
jgi:hypothetical protein